MLFRSWRLPLDTHLSRCRQSLLRSSSSAAFPSTYGQRRVVSISELGVPELVMELRLRGVQADSTEDSEELEDRLRTEIRAPHVRLLSTELGLSIDNSRTIDALPDQLFASDYHGVEEETFARAKRMARFRQEPVLIAASAASTRFWPAFQASLSSQSPLSLSPRKGVKCTKNVGGGSSRFFELFSDSSVQVRDARVVASTGAMLSASMPRQTGPERSRVCRLGDLPAVISGQRVQDDVEGARHGRKWRKVNNFPRAGDDVLAFHTGRGSFYRALRDAGEFPLDDRRANDESDELAEQQEHQQHAALRSVSMHAVTSIGSPLGGLAFHRHDTSWLALLSGRKLWCFCSPEHPPPSAHRRMNIELAMLEPHVRIAVQRPGEIMYLPRGWWHATYNLGPEVYGEEELEDLFREFGGDELDDSFVIGVGGLGHSPGLHWYAAEGDVDALARAAGAVPIHASSTFEYEDNYDDDGLDFNKDAVGQEDLDGEEDAKYGDLDEIDTEGAFSFEVEDGKRVFYDLGALNVSALREKTSTGKTLMHTACYHGNVAVARWLAAIDPPPSGHLRDVSTETTAGDVCATDALGMQPLHWAAVKCQLPRVHTISFLLEHGAHPRAPSALGETPLDIAKKQLRKSSKVHKKNGSNEAQAHTLLASAKDSLLGDWSRKNIR